MQKSNASLVEREVARRSRDGGIVWQFQPSAQSKKQSLSLACARQLPLHKGAWGAPAPVRHIVIIPIMTVGLNKQHLNFCKCFSFRVIASLRRRRGNPFPPPQADFTKALRNLQHLGDGLPRRFAPRNDRGRKQGSCRPSLSADSCRSAYHRTIHS